ASEYANEALEHFKALNDDEGKLYAYSALFSVYTERTSEVKDFSRAQSLYDEASKLKSFRLHSSTINMYLLEMYPQVGRYHEAIEISQSILSQCEELHDNVCIASTHLSLCENYVALHDNSKANVELELSSKYVPTINDFYLSGRFLYVRAKLETSENMLSEAVEDYSNVVRMISQIKEG